VQRVTDYILYVTEDAASQTHSELDSGLKVPNRGGRGVSVEASEMVSIPRAELDALKAELTRLQREVGRGAAWERNHDGAGPGNDTPRRAREALVRAWGISV
jgi:hypothetical protein